MEFINTVTINKNRYSQKIRSSLYFEKQKKYVKKDITYEDICEILISQNEIGYSLLNKNERSTYILRKKIEIASDINISKEIYNSSFKQCLISNGLQNKNHFSSILYLNDFYKCNCIILNKDTNEYYQTGLKEGTKIFCVYHNSHWIFDSDKPFVDDEIHYSDIEDLKNILIMDIPTNMIYQTYLQSLSKYKLNDLQNIALENEIPIKINNKNKVKKQIYDEINLKKLTEHI
jgi:hypothetical protein